MQLSNTLKSGKLIKRYKRFFADIDYNNEVLTAHCPNPGAMTGLAIPGQKVLFSTSNNKNRKLRYTLEFVEIGNYLVGVNTLLPNKLVSEALANKKISKLKQYSEIKPEFKFSQGIRFDFLLTGQDLNPCILEVKNVQLRLNLNEKIGIAEFPDSITERGSKHLKNLSVAISKGYRSVMLYVVQRMDCEKLTIAKEIDPIYAENFINAKKNGVEMEVWACDISIKEIKLSHQLQFTEL